jgi:hypothetical protein
VEREPLERAAVEREEAERDPVERDPVERDPVERAAVERAAVERVPLDRLVLLPEREEEEFALVNAAFSLSKSLSACLLVRAALRRSAESAVVTSL